MENHQTIFQDYVRRMKEIRLLSTPDMEEITDSEEYSRVLSQNLTRIGELATENRKVIDTYVNPALFGEKKLTEDERTQLVEFAELLLEDDSFKEVDQHLSETLSDFLFMSDIGAGEVDDNIRVISMAKKVKRDYFIISGLTRYYNPDTERVRKKAIENRDLLAEYLKKETFPTLSDEAKGHALQYSLMGALLYENNLERKNTAYWEQCLSIIDTGQTILTDPFYREHFPDYDWESYEFRIYYYGSFMAYSILPEKIAKRVHHYAEKACDFLKTCKNEGILNAVDEKHEQDLLYLASVQARWTPLREACDAFYDAYEKRDKEDYSVTGINHNLDTPSSYLCMAKMMGYHLTEKDHDRYAEIEKSVLDYLYRVPKKSDRYLKCVTLLANLPVYFKEVPGAMTMEEFCVKAFAAIHPPTYIHVNMVARFAECMARHLLMLRPDLFIGFPGCADEEQVKNEKDRIISYIWHASLCHDIGKLFIIDVISMYGRALLDDEFAIIKDHPVIGARIAEEHVSTKDYVDVIKGHHLWYDCSRGYPLDFDTFQSPYKTVIDIVLVADCLDAATDTVGRSYNRGKTFLEFGQELAEGAGTRYAPFFVDLFSCPELKADIEYLLSEGRKNMYRETFRLLKSNGENHTFGRVSNEG